MLHQSKGLLFALALLAALPAAATTQKYRASWREDPSTTMVLGWHQVDGQSPTVYYDTTDHGTNAGAYAFQHGVDRSVAYFGMNNRFARLTGLQPDTVYYFVIADSNSTSARMKFRTAPADDTPFTVIAGGDSRNNWDVRLEANQMVSKLKPLYVAFGGDMTSGDTSSEWQAWMDHWQETITSDGRLIPVVAARGNHETGNASIVNMFDVPQAQVYYALSFGDRMLRTYTLNSEDVEGGNQAAWLAGDLAAHQNTSWRFAQYHKPMRPHVSSKSEGNSEYSAWAQLFYDYAVNLVVECDSHMVKSTWPVRPYTGSGNDEGFIRDDARGTVYVGEGTWGAPLRAADDAKTWTRESGSFNQFKWIYVTRTAVQLKTVQYQNVAAVGEVDENFPYTPPAGLQTWGAVIELTASDAPSVALTAPADGTLVTAGQTVAMTADAASPSGTITAVGFYVDGNLVSEDTSAPYTAAWTAAGNGAHTLTAQATDDLGHTVTDSVTVHVGTAVVSVRVASGNDDAEEHGNGSIDLTSTDLELITETDAQTVGMRFAGLDLPAGATITDARIQFTVDETGGADGTLIFRAQDSGDAAAFTTATGNIGNRPVTAASVSWNPPAWNSVGAAGADQQTPNLASVIQEVVDRGDWAAGNALVVIVTGAGRRTAESYNGSAASAPLLTVTYTAGGSGGNTPPTAGFSHAADNLNVAFTDTSSDSDGSIVSWSWSFGDGATSTARHPNHGYTAPGSYTVMLTVTDDAGAQDGHAAVVTVSAPGGPTSIDNGVPVTGLAGSAGSWQDFSIDVPTGATALNVVMSGGSGDADLYVQFDAAPDAGSYDCRPYTTGDETCSFANPAAGRWYVSLFGYSAYSGITLRATYTTGGGGTTSVSVRVSAGNDDAEERTSNGAMSLSSTDLELVDDGTRGQLVGMLFRGLDIPRGAVIVSAQIQFTVDETDSKATHVTFYAEATGSAQGFTSSTGNISSRTVTAASVSWQPAAWSSVGQAGAAQQSPNLAALVQEVVDRGDWNPGNNLAILVEGSGERTAESYNGSAGKAPLLTLTYQ